MKKHRKPKYKLSNDASSVFVDSSSCSYQAMNLSLGWCKQREYDYFFIFSFLSVLLSLLREYFFANFFFLFHTFFVYIKKIFSCSNGATIISYDSRDFQYYYSSINYTTHTRICTTENFRDFFFGTIESLLINYYWLNF